MKPTASVLITDIVTTQQKQKDFVGICLARTLTCLQPLNFSVPLSASALDPGFGAHPGAVGCWDSGTEALSAVSAVCHLRYTL